MLQSNQKIIRHKVGLLNLAEELGNVLEKKKLDDEAWGGFDGFGSHRYQNR